MNISDYKKAQCLEENFNTAVNYRYSRSISGEPLKVFQELCKTYNIHLNINCNECVFNALKKLGQMYFSFQESLKQEEHTSDPVIPAQATPTVAEDKPTEVQEPEIIEPDPEPETVAPEAKTKKPKQEKK